MMVDTAPGIQIEERTEIQLAPLYRVLVHNDDLTPMDFVVSILREIFRRERQKALDIMLEAHHTGVAHVVTEPLERAEFHVDQARSLSRARHYPLSFSVEPER